MKIHLLSYIIISLLVSCGKTEPKNAFDVSKKTTIKYSPLSFIQEMRKPNVLNVSTIEVDFQKNWVMKKHIDSLINIVDSEEKCNCYVNPISSKIPNDNAEVGGYAIEFIKSFKEQRKVDLGLYYCPKSDKKASEELKRWWKKYKESNLE